MRRVSEDQGCYAAQVLIVGAGPTGLMLALCLKQYGITVDIVDCKSGPSADSKALAINPMSQLQEALFFGKNIVGKSAIKVDRLSVQSGAAARLTGIDLNRLPWPYRHMLVQTQFDTERELADYASEQGVSIRWNTQVVSVRDHQSHVEATTEAEGGARETQHYLYVVGCDGKRSLIRSAMGAVYDQKAYDLFLALADYEFNIDLDRSSAHYLIYDDTFFVLVPLGETLWRVVVKHEGALPQDFNDDLIRKPIAQHLGDGVLKGEPVWKSMAPLYVSVADKLRQGRLFICGDAAHLYSPIGGTGMNTGFLDALNLGWKLAYQLLGYVSDGQWLSSYQAERLPAIKENAQSTDRMTRLIAGLPHTFEEIEPFLPRLKNRSLIKGMLPTHAAGYAVRYEAGGLDSTLALVLSNFRKSESSSVPLIMIFELASTDGELWKVSELGAIPRGVSRLRILKQRVASSGSMMMNGRLYVSADLWDELRQRGDIAVVRPDGVVLFHGSKDRFMKAKEQIFSLLITEQCRSEYEQDNLIEA